MWNELLNESKSQRKFSNTPVIVLGRKHNGKKKLIDSLLKISKTQAYRRKDAQLHNDSIQTKGNTAVIDYAYINVLDLADMDNKIYSKLQLYIIEDYSHPEIYSELTSKQVLQRAIVIVTLDFTTPWNFEEEINQWINFIYELQKAAGFTISELKMLADEVQKTFKRFKEPQFDQNGKFKKKFHFEQVNELDDNEIPLPEGVLENNLRFPFIISVNKCDLQASVLRDDSSKKIMFVLYHLRKTCIKYGGTLVYTSIKNNINLNLLYEYLLHRAYGMPFRFKSEAVNEEAIFIPLGFDNNELLNGSVVGMDVSGPYGQLINAPQNKKVERQEQKTKDDSKYFQKFFPVQNVQTVVPIVKKQSNEARIFFQKLLNDTKKKPTSSEIDSQSVDDVKEELIKQTTEAMKKK